MTDPAKSTPNTTFAAAIEVNPPAVAGVNAFRVALAKATVHLGWIGKNDLGWAILVSDVAKALTLELYPYGGVNYYRIKGTDRYMSLSNQSYVGFYGWVGARGWTKDGSHLISQYNSQALSYFSPENAYLYCWDQYTVLDVTFQNV